jgi:hypothetical protein
MPGTKGGIPHVPKSAVYCGCRAAPCGLRPTHRKSRMAGAKPRYLFETSAAARTTHAGFWPVANHCPLAT